MKIFSKVETTINTAEDNETVIVMLNNCISDYETDTGSGFLNNIVWFAAISKMEYKENDVNKELYIYSLKEQEETICRLVKQEKEDIKLYDLIDKEYKDFYVTATVYSTSDKKEQMLLYFNNKDKLWG